MVLVWVLSFEFLYVICAPWFLHLGFDLWHFDCGLYLIRS